MGEKLKIFADLYTVKAKEAVDQATARLEKFKVAREAALKLTTPINDKYKTLGDLVADMFPEEGGTNDNLFRNLYANATVSDEEKKSINSLFKLSSAPLTLTMAENRLKNGGDAAFNTIMRSLGKLLIDAGISFKELVGSESTDPDEKKIENFSSFLTEIRDISIPFGLGSSSELYYAVVENGDPIGKKKEAASSPINEKPEETASAPTSTINEPKTEAPAAAGASALNPEKKEAPSQVTESSSVSASPTEMPVEPAKTETAGAPAVTVNVESTAPALPKTESTAPAEPATSPEAAAPSTTINETKSTTNVQTSSTSVSSTINPEAKATSPEALVVSSSFGFLDKSAQEKLTSELKATKEKESTINESKVKSKSSTSTEKSELEKISTTETINNISEKEKESSDTTSTINEGEKSSEISKEKLEALNYFLGSGFSESIGGASEKKEEPLKKESTQAALPKEKTKTDVTKSTPSLPVSKAPTPSEKEAKPPSDATPAVSAVAEPSEAAPPAPPMETGQTMPAGEASVASSGIDMSALESRLARIELLLTGPLDVKIVE